MSSPLFVGGKRNPNLFICKRMNIKYTTTKKFTIYKTKFGNPIPENIVAIPFAVVFISPSVVLPNDLIPLTTVVNKISPVSVANCIVSEIALVIPNNKSPSPSPQNLKGPRYFLFV